MEQWREVLTLPEAANYLRVSERTLWELAKDDKVPYFKVGNQYRFHLSALRQIASQEAGGVQ